VSVAHGVTSGNAQVPIRVDADGKLVLSGSPTFAGLTLSGNLDLAVGSLIRWGTTSSEVALKRSGVTLQARLGDDSNYANFRASRFDLASGSLLSDTSDGVIRFSNSSASGLTATIFGTNGGATSRYDLQKKVTSIADNSATAVFTVTVPNAAHAAGIEVFFLSSNGSTDAFESSRIAIGTVVLARTAGVDTVATANALTNAGIATVAAGATHTLAYGVSAMSGASSATQTFTITVTIDDTGNTGSNQVVAVARLLNAEATGVTIA
jgi:hypothetical protein